jgi:hypothetical protein
MKPSYGPDSGTVGLAGLFAGKRRTRTQAMMCQSAQYLYQALPWGTAKDAIARDVFRVFRHVRGRYASVGSFAYALKDLTATRAPIASPLAARCKQNQTPTQVIMLDVARFILANSAQHVSKWDVAKRVFDLFQNVKGCYATWRAFYKMVKRLG